MTQRPLNWIPWDEWGADGASIQSLRQRLYERRMRDSVYQAFTAGDLGPMAFFSVNGGPFQEAPVLMVRQQ
jgi:hypothetical protein